MWGADESVALGHRARKLRRDAEVGQLHPAALGEEDIAALDVAMDFEDRVEVHKALQRLPAQVRDLRFVQG